VRDDDFSIILRSWEEVSRTGLFVMQMLLWAAEGLIDEKI
jgi:hypothetical protein